ncbi:MAG: hypothetical protein FWG02_03785 [Holophagaceae bacterium]|nr:hypothetical protein [Holophagaceae bacterium]
MENFIETVKRHYKETNEKWANHALGIACIFMIYGLGRLITHCILRISFGSQEKIAWYFVLIVTIALIYFPFMLLIKILFKE